MKKGGGEGLLILLAIIVMIIIWAGIIILIGLVVAGIVYGIMALVKYYQNKKRLALEEKIKYENELSFLNNEITECNNKLRTAPSSIFIQSYLEILPIKIEILKGEYQVAHSKMQKEEKENLLNQIESQKIFLKKHKKKVIYTIPYDLDIAYKEFIGILEKIRSSGQIWDVRKRNKKDLYFWASNMTRTNIKISKECFNDVYCTNGIDIYCIVVNENKYYFYPEGIIEAKSNISYTKYDYSTLFSKLKKIIVIEDQGNTKGATNIGYRYLHTRTDGGPDLRYSYNPRYPENQYGNITLSPIQQLCFDISNYYYAQDLHQSINKLRLISTKNSISSHVDYDINETPLIEDKSSKTEKIIYNLDSNIHCVIQKIIVDRGLQIINDKSFVSILDDYHVFKDKIYLKNIIKLIQSEGYAQKLALEEPSIINFESYTKDLAEVYLLEPKYVEELLTYIFKPINYSNDLK